MEQEERSVRFDAELGVEAYRFIGLMQKFPNHFHPHYVIGFIESGGRRLICKNTVYTLGPGDMTIFNPLDNHTCEQLDAQPLDYRCINIKSEVMQNIMREITGEESLPVFTPPVIYNCEFVSLLRELHQMLMQEKVEFEKEEAFYFLMEQLIRGYTTPSTMPDIPPCDAVQRACTYMMEHFNEYITLDDISRVSGLNKYTLLRTFTRRRGITPYRYLETLRVNHAMHLLEQGVEPLEAAGQSGFADQSHFTKFFKNFIGLTPKQYQRIFTNDDK